MTDFGDVPAGTPPHGAVTILDQNSDIWLSILAVSIITMVVLTFSIVLRLYAKIFVARSPNWEDYLSLFASTVLIAWTVLFNVNCHLGVSKHQWNVRASRMPTILSNLNIGDLLLGPMLGTAKLALIMQIKRCSNAQRKPSQVFDWYTYATVAVVVGYYIAAIFVAAFQCTPRRGIWDPTINARCIDVPGAVFTEGGFALLTDVMVFALFGWLVAVVGARQLGGAVMVLAITVVALLGISCSAASLYYRMPFLGHETDLTYHIGRLQIWAVVEYTSVIVVGCIPAIGSLLLGRGKKETNHTKERQDQIRTETARKHDIWPEPV